MSAPPAGRKTGGAIAALLGGLLAMAIVFAMFELGAWLVFRAARLTRSTPPEVTYPYHPYLGWENLPHHTYRGILAGGLHAWTVRTDSLGRGATPHASHPEPRVDVALVGGSAAFGVGQTSNETTLANQLERELERRTGARVEVHNLAVGGYTSFQEALALERFLSNHRADVVVSLSGYNDAFAAAIEGGPDFGLLLHRLDPKTEMVRSIERGELKVLPVAAQAALGALRRRSYAVDLLGKVTDRLRPPPPAVPWTTAMPDSAELARRARFVLTNYAMMDGMARQNGARFFLFLQPTAMNRATLTAPERQAMDSLSREFMARARPAVRIFYPTMLAAPKTFEMRDLSPVFDAFPDPAFADECHYLDGAAPVLAAAIAEAVAPAVGEAARRAPPPGRAASGSAAGR